jgi:hypothetical protein
MDFEPYSGELGSAPRKRKEKSEAELRESFGTITPREPAPDFPRLSERNAAINGGRPADLIGVGSLGGGDVDRPPQFGIDGAAQQQFEPWEGITDQELQQRTKSFYQDTPFGERQAVRLGAGLTNAAQGMRQVDAKLGEKLHGTWLGKLLGSYDPAEGRSGQVEREIIEKRAIDAPALQGFGPSLVGAIGEAAPFAIAPQKAAQSFGGALARNAGVGAVQGATAPALEDESRLANAGLGALGGSAGTALGAGTGRVMRPVRQSSLTPPQTQLVAKALSEGFRFTPGQTTGNKAFSRIESVLEDMGMGGKLTKNAAHNQELINQRALETVGVRGQKSVTPQMLDDAADAISAQFENISRGRGVSIDQKFLQDLDAVELEARQVIKSARAPKLEESIADLRDMAQMDIVPFGVRQKNISSISEEMRALTRAGKHSDARQLGQVVEAMHDMAGRSMTGEDLVKWADARQQFSNLMKIYDSVDEAGNVVGSKLSAAVKKDNKRAYARSSFDENELKFLGEVGKLQKDRLPNSGTAPRMWLQNLLTGVGGVAGTVTGGLVTGVGGAMVDAFGPRVAQKALTSKYFMPRAASSAEKLLSDPATRSSAAIAAALLPDLFRASLEAR